MTDDAVAAQDAARCAVELAAPFERVFALLAQVVEAMSALCDAAADDGRILVAADLAVLTAPIEAALAADRLPVGVGVVVEPGLLGDRDRYLEWLQRDLTGTPVALLLDLDPAGEDPYDYPEMEWFRVPRVEGRRMVGGPYFDYRGTDRYALTFAVPVLSRGRFVGVAGADVPLPGFEAEALPLMRRLGQRAALVNHERRVVTANTPSFVTGARLRADDAGAPPQVLDVVADLGWQLVLPVPAS